MRSHKEDHLFWTAVLLCTLYLCYRYPLQINSSGTSSTYSDTPLIFQIGKFVLSIPFFVVAMWRCVEKRLSERQWFIVSAVVFLSVFSITKTFTDFDPRYFEQSFWILFPLVLVWGAKDVGIVALDRYFRFLFIFSLASTALELFLFLAFGRLPALGYANSILVRFGGFLDDPNGFAALLFLLLGWADKRYAGLKRRLAIGAIGVALLLTQSLTAIGFLALICLIRVVLGMRRHFLLLIVCIVCIGLMVPVAYREIMQSYGPLLAALWDVRQVSVEQHLSWMNWGPKWYEWFLLGDSTYNFSESWWASATVNFGVPWLLTFIALTSLPLFTLRKAIPNARPELRPIYSGIFLFLIYCLVGSFNLPFFTVFPVNFLFFVFLFLLEFKLLRLPILGADGGLESFDGNLWEGA